MKNPILRQQLPQNDTKRIDVHSWCDRVLLGPLHGVLVLANGAQQLWSSIARVAHLQMCRRIGRDYKSGLKIRGYVCDRADTEQLSGSIVCIGIAM